MTAELVDGWGGGLDLRLRGGVHAARQSLIKHLSIILLPLGYGGEAAKVMNMEQEIVGGRGRRWCRGRPKGGESNRLIVLAERYHPRHGNMVNETI